MFEKNFEDAKIESFEVVLLPVGGDSPRDSRESRRRKGTFAFNPLWRYQSHQTLEASEKENYL